MSANSPLSRVVGTSPSSSSVDDAVLTPAEGWALVASQPLAQLSNMALLPSLGALRADLELTYSELGIVVSAFGLARLIMDLPAGGLARRWNPRSVLLVAFAISAVASGVGLAAATAWQVTVVRFLIGIASSTAQAMILAWLVGGAGRAARGRVMARSEALFSLVGLIVPALSGLLADSLGWRVAFLLGALAAAIGFGAVFFFTRASGAARSVGQVQPRRTGASDPRQVAGGSGVLDSWRELRVGGHVLFGAYVATFVVFFCRNGLLNAVLPVLGSDRFGMPTFGIGLLFSAISAVSIGIVLLGGRMADRFGRFRLLTPGLAIILVCQLFIFLIQDPLTYIAIGLLQAVSFFVNPLPTVLLGDALPARARAQGIAIYRAVSDLALLCGPSAMGLALQLGSFPAAELSSVAVVGISLVLVVVVTARSQRLSASPPAR